MESTLFNYWRRKSPRVSSLPDTLVRLHLKSHAHKPVWYRTWFFRVWPNSKPMVGGLILLECLPSDSRLGCESHGTVMGIFQAAAGVPVSYRSESMFSLLTARQPG